MTNPESMQPAGEITLSLLQRRIRVARGQEPGDLVLTGGQVVNVFTQDVTPGNVVIADGWIAGVGPYDWQAKERIDVKGQAIIPGLIDGHIHVESTLLAPAELTKLMVPHGTSALIADPHEIANVLGIPGVDMLIQASAGLPLDFFFMASSCVPDASWEDSGAVIDAAGVATLLRRQRVRGLAEVMDLPAVLGGQPDMLNKILAAGNRRDPVDGHAPGMVGQTLVAYVAAGIRADHESTTVEEALQKAALGMMVQVREGSSERNLDTFLPLMVEDRIGDWCLCSDDIHPDDLKARGHLDGLLKRCVAAGIPPARAVRHATLIPARHYASMNRGGIAPGYRADLAVVADLKSFEVKLVIKDGQVVARDGRYLGGGSSHPVSTDNTVNLGPITEEAFQLFMSSDQGPVIGIVPDQIVTTQKVRTVARQDGSWSFDPNRNIVLIASIERHRALGRVGVGLVEGFGFRKHGAIASTFAHDSHNLIVAGTNAKDMLTCVKALAECGGGWVAASEGAVRARLPLPVAGLMTTATADEVCRGLAELHAVTQSLGCPLPYPFGTLSFLALPVIPALRITDQGMFDVNAQQFVKY